MCYNRAMRHTDYVITMKMGEWIERSSYGLAFIRFIAQWGWYLVLVGAGVVIYLMNQGMWLETAIYLGASTFLARFICTELIRLFWKRKRPYAVLQHTPPFSQLAVVPAILYQLPVFSYLQKTAQYSFPSGHAALYGAISFVIWWRFGIIGWIFLGATLFMGMARVAAVLHWFSDVCVGLLIGILSAVLVIYSLGIDF